MEVPERPERAEGELAEQPVARAPRRGRGVLFVAGAAVLGMIAGTCAGYLVQADREPTELPPLSQPVMDRAEGEGPEPLSAAQDRKVRTDGDLRRLLLKKPAGAKKAEWLEGADGWMTMADYSGDFTEPNDKFGALVNDEFRRAAVVGWEVGNSYNVEIRLVQFRQHNSMAADDSSNNHQTWAEEQPDADSWAIKGTGDGMAYVHTRPDTEPGYEPMYRAEAHAWRGDVAMEIWVYGGKQVPKKMIMDLAERQMERL
ncbi:hypothetical protein PV383_24015 [Streptomyces caniscabiei]|uniref:Secreted protein n=1 Tax=Streptomyces caniscabiei TaxID=2746961 RepID=A0ABU4MTT6_9ACTN|nr:MULTISPECIES: hypothetical protein [Streptomyces]MBE4738096.1 hypothetical protein [Streptomyces caniscabiei]MBE4756859.1 hypothetical protein [Streptomyces caniscabiei]MBE4773799.1 hypothetical protein [Streptomyces caniscabiei]MBE4785631.1 hypothetical protein [Streptomyces caniscabiei]MBE4796974.1 hypothetical protein [Streptomyces caniscabiei]